jgi:DNA-directed RNA polymerase specialized sigma subunit
METKRKRKNYMSNKEFFDELMRCQKKGVMSNQLGQMFKMLVERYATKPKFSGYTYKDEMIGFGIMACCAAFEKFDSNKSNNPFAFFTQVTHNTFLQVLNKEKRQQNIRDEILLSHDLNPSFGYLESHKDGKDIDQDFEDNSHEELEDPSSDVVE